MLAIKSRKQTWNIQERASSNVKDLRSKKERFVEVVIGFKDTIKAFGDFKNKQKSV